jgi:hypothetical protein
MTRGCQPLRPPPLIEVHLLPHLLKFQFLSVFPPSPTVVINGRPIVAPRASSAKPTPL